MDDIIEKLTADDPVEKWIEDFVSSDDSRFDGKSKKERINMALGAYYAATKKNESISEKRELKLAMLTLQEDDENMVRYFVENNSIENKSIVDVREAYVHFRNDLSDEHVSLGEKGMVVALAPYGAVKIGDTYTGVWRHSAYGPGVLRLDLDRVLPRATQHPVIFYTLATKKLEISKEFKLL